MMAIRTDINRKTKPMTPTSVFLKFLIHSNAIVKNPRRYLIAVWWRILGKRLRARAQMAPLFGISYLTYRLWLYAEEPVDSVLPDENDVKIIALVDTQDIAQDKNDALKRTLDSLAAEGVSALLVKSSSESALSEVASAIDWNLRPWLMPLRAGDVIAQGTSATYRLAAAKEHGIIYADDDLINKWGQRHAPHFKPSWNAELFQHFDYMSGACIIRSLEEDFNHLKGEGWVGGLISAALGRANSAPMHLAHVLHHRVARPAPCIPNAELTLNTNAPRVSIIVPTRNRVDLLRTCLDGVARTNYENIEVIVIDNGSDDAKTLHYLKDLEKSGIIVIRCPGPFNFSSLNNHASAKATGELLCFLNNDIEIVDPDWLRTMVSQALHPEIGAVGAKLLYPDGRIQHAGVVIGIGGGAAHAHRLLHPDEEGYFHRHSLPQFASAVTAACLLVRKECFDAVNGFDEENFAVAFNDVDLCLRLNKCGWQSFYEPRATLIHHESVSRGLDRDPAGAARLAREFAALQRIWGTHDTIDPFHHPQLSPFSEQFALQI